MSEEAKTEKTNEELQAELEAALEECTKATEDIIDLDRAVDEPIYARAMYDILLSKAVSLAVMHRIEVANIVAETCEKSIKAYEVASMLMVQKLMQQHAETQPPTEEENDGEILAN